MRTIETIRQEVEEFLLFKDRFNLVLKRDDKLYKDKLAKIFIGEDFSLTKSYHFICNPSYLKFIGNPIRIEQFEPDYLYEFLYISDFEYNGFVSLSDDIPYEIKIEGTIKVLTTRSIPMDLNVNEMQIINEVINLFDPYSIEFSERGVYK